MRSSSTILGKNVISFISSEPADNSVSVIFIHGFPFDKSIWTEQLNSLPANIHGIAYDIRGFGESTSEHHFFSIDLFARDLVRLIDELDIKRCVLCGISMGGYIALRTVQLASNKISGLILSDTNCVSDGNEAKQKRLAAIEQVLEGRKTEFTQGFIESVFDRRTIENNPETVEFLRAIINSTADSTICATQLALASRTDSAKVLKDIKVPTMIIRGENDALMTEEQTQQLVTGVSNAEFVIIPQSGHLPNLENPDAFSHAINGFLRKHFLS